LRIPTVVLLLVACGPFDDDKWCQNHPDDCVEVGTETPPTTPPTTPTTGGELADQAKSVMQTYCYGCHGENGVANGGFNYALSVPGLLGSGKIVPSNTAGSLLLDRMEDRTMPPTADKPSDAEIDIIRQWIDAGAPDWDPDFCTLRDRVTPAEEMQIMTEDILALPRGDRKFTRYFTLAHLWNACLPEDELDTVRFGLSKSVNHLSFGARVVPPEPVDPDGVILRVDVRNYKWDLVNLNGVAAWNKAVSLTPGAQTRPGGDVLRTETQDRLPYLPADWFVYHGTRPPIYEAILKIPPTEDEFLLGNPGFPGFGVDTAANRTAQAGGSPAPLVRRAGFVQSGVSVSNRLVERHRSAIDSGAYCWVSFDMASEAGSANLLSHPLSPDDNIDLIDPADPDCARQSDFEFTHDGGEIICSLPNGLQAYYLSTAAGDALSEGPLAIVQDLEGPTAPVVTNGVSCMFCHAQGIISKVDEIAAHWGDNVDDPALATLFPGCVAEYVESVYKPDEVLQFMEDDRAKFQAAQLLTGVPALQETEPVTVLVRTYEADMSLQRVAAELGMNTIEPAMTDDLVFCIDQLQSVEPEAAVALTPLLTGKTISREQFEEVAADVICGCAAVPHDANQCLLFPARAVATGTTSAGAGTGYALPPDGPCGDGTDDEDCDGLSTADELALGTDPLNADTDDDFLTDEEEVNVWRTNPLVVDTDRDLLTDGEEVALGLDPVQPDTDGDRLPDGGELFGFYGDGGGGGETGGLDTGGVDPFDLPFEFLSPPRATSPWEADTDGGGVDDGNEYRVGTNPLEPRDDAEVVLADLSCGDSLLACPPGFHCIVEDRDPFDIATDIGACGVNP
jgi:hypothetical protein